MKAFVWVSTDWVQHTIGTTGLLLSHGWGRAVEIVQVVAMLAVYGAAAAAIRRGRRPLPWMAFALLVFSMTTLWPVIYLYFDVCLLCVCRGAGGHAVGCARARRGRRGPARSPRRSLILAIGDVDRRAGQRVDRRRHRRGSRLPLFRVLRATSARDDVTFAWINGTRAEILIPRRSRRDATIDLVCQPHLPTPGVVQQLSASLNGTIIGTVTLKAGLAARRAGRAGPCLADRRQRADAVPVDAPSRRRSPG